MATARRRTRIRKAPSTPPAAPAERRSVLQIDESAASPAEVTPERCFLDFTAALARYGDVLSLEVIEADETTKWQREIRDSEGVRHFLTFRHPAPSIVTLVALSDEPPILDEYQRLARQSGAAVISRGLLSRVPPEAAWMLTVYDTLRGTEWANKQLADDLLFNESGTSASEFAASVETWRRLLPLLNDATWQRPKDASDEPDKGAGLPTLNRYAKLAGVPTPGRGRKNHRYSFTDTSRILETIIKQTPEGKFAENCENALQEIATKITSKSLNHF
jgi:hypothetical protein